MTDINKKPLIENQDFVIYGNEDLHSIKEELLSHLVYKKQELLSFFHLSTISQISIYLFQNREEYFDFLSQYFTSTNYSYGSATKNAIYYCYSNVSKNQCLPFLKINLSHELAHIMYSYLYENCFSRPIWLDEGLAQVLSGEKEKLKDNDFAFRNFYFDRIVRRDKEIPPIEYLKKHGSVYGKFLDNKTNKYDGYALAYLLVRYLMETKENLYAIITDATKIENLEPTILEECIHYYNQKYPVQSNFYDIKTDGELMDYMNKYILYGWLDKEKHSHINTLKGFHEQYRTSSIEEILNTKLATCIGQAKLIQHWFQLKGIENKLFCLRNTSLETDIHEIEMHCFVLFHYQENWYHFEHSATEKRGIYKFSTLEEAIENTTMKFLRRFHLKELTEIPSIPDGLTYQELNQYISSFPIYEVEKSKTI